MAAEHLPKQHPLAVAFGSDKHVEFTQGVSIAYWKRTVKRGECHAQRHLREVARAQTWRAKFGDDTNICGPHAGLRIEHGTDAAYTSATFATSVVLLFRA